MKTPKNIAVGCVPHACIDYIPIIHLNNNQMSVPWVGGVPQVNKFEQVSGLDHRMLAAEY